MPQFLAFSQGFIFWLILLKKSFFANAGVVCQKRADWLRFLRSCSPVASGPSRTKNKTSVA
jgi:hypothetical protein